MTVDDSRCFVSQSINPSL